jgi:hypothetical protein
VSVILLHSTDRLPEQWVVVAMRAGKIVPMYPRRIPICGSQQEALERTEILRSQDAGFAAKWDGWMFVQMEVSRPVFFGRRPGVTYRDGKQGQG